MGKIEDRGWLIQGKKAYFFEQKFKTESDAKKYAEKRKSEDRYAVVKKYSLKREEPYLVFVTKFSKKKNLAFYIDKSYAEKKKERKIINEWVNLKSPIPRDKLDIINKKIRSYKNMKSLNPGQKKILKDLENFKEAAKKLHVDSRNKMAELVEQKLKFKKARLEEVNFAKKMNITYD